MYFSLILPTPGYERDAAASRMRGPYRDHQWLWNFFSAPEGHPRDFLFRRSELDSMSRYHVVSMRPPGAPPEGWSINSREYDPRLPAGARLRFELRANPVSAHQRDGKSRRDDVVMHAKRRLLNERGLQRWKDWQGGGKPALYEFVREACKSWLDSRAEKAGFTFDEEYLRVDSYQQHVERTKGNKLDGAIRFSTVDFSGLLTVTEPEQFRRALTGGIGRAKAFGCGLLLVRPA